MIVLPKIAGSFEQKDLGKVTAEAAVFSHPEALVSDAELERIRV